ncbi:AraC family transcriptional regulator [uncultured Limnohabitans sp.]|mgnify:CR=1 FL=1|jgi:AraC-like DNA-binding protein|uniref:AraC family transcriptional regulator n=1 Tax=uncultured Limnohabitans sp. TaxID=768543 RepID=UPI00261210B4|nr:AraC family transcriptional regulator [uncultured Limnohabitans sp.]
MDALSSVLSRIALRAGVFYSGNLCDLHDFEHDVFKGHLHLIERGPIVLQTQGQADVHLNEPTVLFLPRPQWHRLVADDGVGADVVCGTIALGGGVHNPVSDSLPDVVLVPLSAMPGMKALLGLMRQEAFEDQPGRQAVLDRLCEVLILQLLRHCMAQGITSGGLLAGLADAKLGKALRAMHEDPAKDWDLPSLAAATGMSRARFAHHFKAVLGHTPAHHLSQWRIQTAQQLMQQGQSIQQAAHAVGYGSASAFTRAFVRALGQTPGAWLTARRADHNGSLNETGSTDKAAKPPRQGPAAP